jgi:hypothetical protein
VAIWIENSSALAALAERESTPAGNREWTRRDANKTSRPKRVGTTRSTCSALNAVTPDDALGWFTHYGYSFI